MKKLLFYLYLLFLITLLGQATFAQTKTLPKLAIPSDRISSISSSDFGLIAGEYDSRIWNNPYNGIFISYDKGNNWTEAGLENRGITDIKYYDHQIYASTYYFIDGNNGLFKTSSNGLDFYHIGPNYSTSKVEVVKDNIYLGTFGHGLWISNNNGISWVQNTQTGGSFSNIIEIKADEDLIIVTTDNNSYISFNNGEDFREIASLNSKKINNVFINKNLILASSSNLNGIYRSVDYGQNFVKIESWGNSLSGAFIEYNNVIYTSKFNQEDSSYYLYSSKDGGINWQNIQTILPQSILDISYIFSLPVSIFINCSNSGLYEYKIPMNEVEYFPYFSLPLKNLSPDTFFNKISAFFDHEYPLLGYYYHQEPIYTTSTTYNFYGNKKDTNVLSYSSHNGIDFLANYLDEVLAVASGYATYYYCDDCGHSIKIDHLNGYQTVYMHLQQSDLITKDKRIWVDKGQTIGRIGLSGRTTGPHLHFQVEFDKNSNGVFDDFPDGNVDPFGWLNEYLLDPWPYYSWSDQKGEHSGVFSKYLWEAPPKRVTQYIQPQDDAIQLNTKTINFNLADTKNNKFTAIISDFISPHIPLEQINLKYVEGTSFSINLYDYREENIINIENIATITIDLTDINLEKFIKESLKLYFYDELEKIWKPLPTIVDLTNKMLIAQTEHFSYFAVLGESLYPKYPLSSLIINDGLQNDYFYSYPEIIINAEDNNGVGIAYTLYSYDGGINWEEYTTPIILEKDGFVDFLYKSIDNAGNLEETKNQIIKINTKNLWTSQVKILNSNFTTK